MSHRTSRQAASLRRGIQSRSVGGKPAELICDVGHLRDSTASAGTDRCRGEPEALP